MLLVSSAVCACGCAVSTGGAASQPASPNDPGHHVGQRGPIRDWLLIGPFPNPELAEPLPDGTSHAGFNHDFLTSAGGEENLVVRAQQVVDAADRDGTLITVQVQPVSARADGSVDLDAKYEGADHMVAYATGGIYSDRDQTVGFFFGSDDGAKIWINGELVHRVYAARGMNIGEDTFTAPLKRGSNTVLVKVSERVYGWGFALEVAGAEEYAAIIAERKYQEDYRAFLNCRIVPKLGNLWDYTFDPGPFPELVWDNPQLAEGVLGLFPLQARWFDADMNEVAEAAGPGRYAFVVEGASDSGVRIRRGGTLYCRPRYWIGWSERPRASLENLFADDVEPGVWEEHEDAIARHVGRELLLSILSQGQGGAVLMAFLDEMEATGRPPSLIDTPLIRDADYHLALKRRVLDVEDKWPSLELPRPIETRPAPTLRSGTPAEAGVSPDTADRIRAVCQRWYDETGEPFVTLVARHGVIVYHEATGEDQNGPVTVDTKFPLASLTKTLTGMMFAQFVDQGLISIDDPIGEFLPDFPTSGDKAITLRQCFTHTSGLHGHEEYGGMHNPWMENVISSGLPTITPGERSEYNGMGYNLAGKVMEMVSGKSIFRLMRENFFDPLGADSTIHDEDLAFGCNTTAGDLALVGQLLLNKGSYGELEFFAPTVFEQMQPRRLDEFYPGVRGESGIGLGWSRDWHPDAGEGDIADDATIFGPNVIGHGSATSCVLRVVLDQDLIIVQTRRRGGRAFYDNLGKMLLAVEEGLVQED